MKGRWAKYVATGVMLAMLAACSSKPTDRGQQYKDGNLPSPSHGKPAGRGGRAD